MMEEILEQILLTARDRAAVRRDVRMPCQVERESDGTPIASECLDLSAEGIRVLASEEASLGTRLRVRFEMPDTGARLDVTALVSRVIRGRRPGEHPLELGLSFADASPLEKAMLDACLSGLPPPVPARRLRIDYARSVQRIAGEGPIVMAGAGP